MVGWWWAREGNRVWTGKRVEGGKEGPVAGFGDLSRQRISSQRAISINEILWEPEWVISVYRSQ
jgi:hypothetical protein